MFKSRASVYDLIGTVWSRRCQHLYEITERQLCKTLIYEPIMFSLVTYITFPDCRVKTWKFMWLKAMLTQSKDILKRLIFSGTQKSNRCCDYTAIFSYEHLCHSGLHQKKASHRLSCVCVCVCLTQCSLLFSTQSLLPILFSPCLWKLFWP